MGGHFPCPQIDGDWPTLADIGKVVTHDGTMHPRNNRNFHIDRIEPNPNYPSQHTPNSSLTITQCGPEAPPCGPNCWPGCQNWANQVIQLPNFTSTNPNQPCNFINNRIAQWTPQSQGGGQYAQQLQCKLDVFDQLAQQYSC